MYHIIPMCNEFFRNFRLKIIFKHISIINFKFVVFHVELMYIYIFINVLEMYIYF